MNGRSLFHHILLGAAFLPLLACNGILDEIYDEPTEATEAAYGFIRVDEASNRGTVYVDATSYTRWIYIDFHSRSIDSLEIADGMKEPTDWDIAVHRYDAKTNGGAVMETSYTSLDALRAAGTMPTGTWVEDEPSQVTVDMSGMMDGNILYADSDVNPVLSSWLHVDTSSMPPVYTLSGKVYVVRLKDGTRAAVRLADFMNEASVKGYMTIDYIYPYE